MGEHGSWESSVTSTPQAGLCHGPMELSPRGFKVFSAVPLCINCCLMPTTLCYTASPASQQEKGVHSTVVVMCKWVSLACLSKVQFSILGHHSPERWQGRVIITGTVIEWQQWQSQQRTFSLAPVMAHTCSIRWSHLIVLIAPSERCKHLQFIDSAMEVLEPARWNLKSSESFVDMWESGLRSRKCCLPGLAPTSHYPWPSLLCSPSGEPQFLHLKVGHFP